MLEGSGGAPGVGSASEPGGEAGTETTWGIEAGTGAAEVPLAEPLARLSGELQAQVEALLGLQDLLGPLIAALPAAGLTGRAGELQELDQIAQSVAALAGFAGELARLAEPGWRVDPARAGHMITLTDLARRLAGQATAPAGGPDAGEVDLF